MVKRYPNPKSILMIIFNLGLLFTFMTLFIWSGHIFGTLSLDDNYYYSEGSYTKDNVTYNFTYWMGMVISSIDGFYVNTDIQLTISEAFINYYGEAIPQDENITVVLRFNPPTRYNGEFYRQTDPIQTEFDGNNRYAFHSYNLIVNYPVSESKHITPVIFANGTQVPGSLEEAIFLDVQPAYMKTQLVLTRVVVILTFWIVFFSIVTVMYQNINYIIKYDEINKKSSEPKRKRGFDEGNKMKFFHDAKEHLRSKDFYKFLRLLFILFASPFFIVNMVIIYGYRTTPDTSFTSLGFTLVSLAIACHAVVIAIDSDEKMKAFADVYFDDVLENFEHYRMQTIPKPDETAYTYSIRNNFLRYKLELNKAIALKRWINVKKQKELATIFIAFVKDLPFDLIQTVDKIEILIMIAKIKEFGFYENELRELVETYFDKKEGTEKQDFDTLVLEVMNELTE